MRTALILLAGIALGAVGVFVYLIWYFRGIMR